MSNLIWAVLQHRDGSLHRGSWEAIAAAHAIATATGGSVSAVVLGDDPSAVATGVAERVGIEAVLTISSPALADYTPGAYVGALAPAVREHEPSVVILPHTYQSMDFYPRLAQAVDGAIVANVTAFEAADGEIVWRRPVMSGKLEARVRVKKAGPIFVSIQASAFSADAVPGGSSTVHPLDVDAASITADREILGVEQAAEEEVDLSKAPVIIAAGRGVGGKDKMGVIEELAAAIGAEIGASRPVIDNGWLPRDRQIGSSGQTVAPKLYVAAGISGAIQHLVGMKGSGCVVAINKDPNAPIFTVADYGIVGDLHEVIPALTAAVREAKGD